MRNVLEITENCFAVAGAFAAQLAARDPQRVTHVAFVYTGPNEWNGTHFQVHRRGLSSFALTKITLYYN